MYSVKTHTNTHTNTNTDKNTHTNTNIPAGMNTDSTLKDKYTELLRTLLILDIVILDKLHGRSNLSLLLIHLRCTLDKFLELSSNEINTGSMSQMITEFHNVMKIVFQNSSYWNLSNLHSIYTSMHTGLYSDISNVDFTCFINKILCCSESLQDYIHFNGNFAKSDIIEYEKIKLHSHFLNTSFKKSSSNLTTNNSTSTDIDSFICPENISIVQSPEFTDFHLKRWEALNLLDRHIFK